MPCELVSPQCGCNAGQACVVDQDGTRLCVTAGTGQVGAVCMNSADCIAGTYCLSINSGPFTCHAFCSADTTCTGPGGLCAITLSNTSGTTIPNVRLCSENCDLITNMGCSLASTGCRLGVEKDGAKRVFTLCAPTGTGVHGSSCATDANCSAGHGC
ncbi:MAG TPA: hypothetical protein PK156_06380, partial [Polyangium sp.]|nr:hypothetical protein [Polyangium sp.]